MRLEHWFYILPLCLRSLLRRRRADQELDEELHDHVQRRIEWAVERGEDPSEARRAALRALGGLDQAKERCRDARRVAWIEDLGRDLRYALRMVHRDPRFAATAIVSLALAIGLNTS